MAKIREVIAFLENIAPFSLQEEYDNAGLIVGDPTKEINGILISLDCLESIVDEAIEKNCNLIICHHPIVFKGLKKLNGSNYVEKVIIKAIQNNIAILAVHTNLDNVILGVNNKFAEKLGLQNLSILAPKAGTLRKITTFAPLNTLEKVAMAMHEAGAGQIGNYKDCSFRLDGTGTYTPIDGAQPFSGEIGKKSIENETRIEMIYPFYLEKNILSALKNAHDYEEVAYYIQVLENENQTVGAGIIGELQAEIPVMDFLESLKKKMEISIIKHTLLVKNKIKKVAICGGSGSFLTKAALRAGADIYISSDFKYHEYFDAEDKIIIADIGHYESEKFTNQLLFDSISNKFHTFAVHLTSVNTNPVFYYQ